MQTSLQRKKSLPDVAAAPNEAMSREEVSVLSSARREEIRRLQEENERLRANPLLYLVSPHVKVTHPFALHIRIFCSSPSARWHSLARPMAECREFFIQTLGSNGLFFCLFSAGLVLATAAGDAGALRQYLPGHHVLQAIDIVSECGTSLQGSSRTFYFAYYVLKNFPLKVI